MHVLRSTGFTLLAMLAASAGPSNSAQACCFPWMWGCCYNGPYSAGYGGGYYSSGYYGSYGYGYPAANWGGCSSCVGGGGCSTCVADGCGVSTPYNNAPVPESTPRNGTPPRDDFERGSGTGTGSGSSGGARSRTFEDSQPPAPGTTAPRRRNRPGNEGLDENRGTGESESSPTTDNFERSEPPERPFNTNREPIPPESTAPEEGATPNDDKTSDDDANPETGVNGPQLGKPRQVDKPVDGETVIRQREPAPIEMPPAPDLDDEQPADAQELRLDDTQSTIAVAPLARLPLKGRFSSPSIVRLRLRPNAQWTATPEPAQVARH